MEIDEPILVAPYDEQWSHLFEQEKSVISAMFGETAPEHEQRVEQEE